jgi:hypothetical protein
MKTTLLTILFLPLLIINNEKPIENLKIQTLPDNSFQFNKSDSTYFVSTNQDENIVYDFKPKNKDIQKPSFEIDFITDELSLENTLLNFSKKQYYKVNDGWLIGCNAGEHGGGLFWFNETGTAHRRINHENIQCIFSFNNEIHILSGLSHLHTTNGNLSRIENIDNQWKAVKSIDLKSKPAVYSISSDNELLIITEDRLLKIKKNYKVRSILKNSFWKKIYPNSIAFKNNEIFIGMRGGIMKINYKKPKNQVWLTE